MKSCQAHHLLSFLLHHEADYLYLVGDIIDWWTLRNRWYWPEIYDYLMLELFKMHEQGTKIYYTPGNHDEFLREYHITGLGPIEVADSFIHKTINGKSYLVIHGDEFDLIIHRTRWLAYLGDKIYGMLLWINRIYNKIRMIFGIPYWSISQYLKLKVKIIMRLISDFEYELMKMARIAGADGAITGHIHHAANYRNFADQFHYVNCGDWVESCTAAVETANGEIKIVHWTKR